jgi:hypothetical protein
VDEQECWSCEHIPTSGGSWNSEAHWRLGLETYVFYLEQGAVSGEIYADEKRSEHDGKQPAISGTIGETGSHK